MKNSIKIGDIVKYTPNCTVVRSRAVSSTKEMIVSGIEEYTIKSKVSLGVRAICERRRKVGKVIKLISYKGQESFITSIPEILLIFAK